MLLQQSTWLEVEAYLTRSKGIVIPTGSTEQHGPIGLIGTDALCAETIATRMGEIADILVAPCIAYTPAQFNLSFPGSISVSSTTLMALISDIVQSLQVQGFRHIYFLNGHGANIAPIRSAVHDVYQKAGERAPRLHLVSWWDFPAVNELRHKYYGDFEGMHATPSEVAITQVNYRQVHHESASTPPAPLSPAFIEAHAGDRHDPATLHRAQFPDGRVGSHTALATPEQGSALIEAAAMAAVKSYQTFLSNGTE